MHENDESIRIDKWLWAARFFKTRSLAADAVAGGKVEFNSERSKPSRVVRIGDRLTIRRGPYEWTIIVTDISRLRGPAPQAQSLYRETAESVGKREALTGLIKLTRPSALASSGRPSKKDRREIGKFTKRGW